MNWFAEGLRFRCEGASCGDCCSGKHGRGAVWLGVEEMRALAGHLALDFDAFTRRFVRGIGRRYSLLEKPNGDCVFYEPERGCRVYQARPRQCRSYPFWPAVVASPATWAAEKAKCPGIDGPETVPAARIFEQLAAGQ